MARMACGYEWIILSNLMLAAFVCANNHGNPANEMADAINKNRTAEKLPQLHISSGLGCMALQYADLCLENFTKAGSLSCRPSEDDFTLVFAPNCGVELPTFGSITGSIASGESKYLEPSQALSQVLIRGKHSLSLMRNKSNNQVGIGMVGGHRGHFFWCVLFSDGKINSTFVLENRGLGIKQKRGCFSGSSFPCSKAHPKAISPTRISLIITGFLLSYVSHHFFCSCSCW